MNDFAPEFTFKEKIRHVLLHSLWAIPLFFLVKFYIFPAFDDFTKIAHCLEFMGGYSGSHILIYGTLVGSPIIFMFIIVISHGAFMKNVYHSGQFPPPGVKVFRKTKISYGFKARFRVYAYLFCIFFLFALSLFGVYSGSLIMSDAPVTIEGCTATKNS